MHRQRLWKRSPHVRQKAIGKMLPRPGTDNRSDGLFTLNGDGQFQEFEVVMRPYKTIGALREAMMARVMQDVRFLEFKIALS